jgi:hypothetical protein
MSNTGVNTNTFRITGKYLDLLNDFVVKTKVHEEINPGRKEQLIDFFSKILDHNNVQPQFQLLSSIIERVLRNTNNGEPGLFLNTLIDEIRNDNTQAILPKIEFVIEVLDSENSNALSKIKGE